MSAPINDAWRLITSRKDHDCVECGDLIVAGARCYTRSSGTTGPIGTPFCDEWLCTGCEWRTDRPVNHEHFTTRDTIL